MSLKYDVSKNLRFTRLELKHLLIVCLVIGFILSFKHWGEQEFNLTQGLTNLIFLIIAASISIFARIIMQKIAGIQKAAHVEFRLWPLGLFLALYIALISNGDWYFLIPGGLVFASIARLKIPKKNQEVDYADMAKISVVGVLTSLLLALVFYSLFSYGNTSLFVKQMINLNFALAIFTMLPLPEIERLIFLKPSTHIMEGLIILYSGRIRYLFWLLFTIIVFLTHWYLGPVQSVIVSLLLAGLISFMTWFRKEL